MENKQLNNLMMMMQLFPGDSNSEMKEFFSALQEVSEMQQLILSHATRAGSSNGAWQTGMLTALRPHLRQDKRRMVDIIIKYLELRHLLTHENTQEASDNI